MGDEEAERLLSPATESPDGLANASQLNPLPSDALATAGRRALRAWLAYAAAAEPFAVVCQGLLMPIALEQYARDNGSLWPEHTAPCMAAATTDPPASGASDVLRCDTRLAGRWVDTSSFSLYTFSVGVALQALLVITLGAAADDPGIRKRLLGFTAIAGSGALIVFLFFPSSLPIWPAASLLAITANTCFGLSLVALNAYLPVIARAIAETADVLSRTTARISARGIAVGYGSGCFLLILCLIPVLLTNGSTWGLRLAIGSTGVWWLVFGTIAVASMPTSIGTTSVKAPRAPTRVLDGWRGLWKMLREASRLPQCFKFLGAWLLLSDGLTTVTNVAILFAKTELDMATPALIIIGLISPLSGIAGALLWPRIAHRLGLSSPQTLVLIVILATLLPLYGCLGFIPFVQRLGFFGLTSSTEMYGIAVYFGLVYGGFQSYSRSVFSSLIPHGQEARFFGLYSITDKSASFIGPLIVGLIADATGSMRLAFLFLVVMLATPIPILAFLLDTEAGRADAEAYALALRDDDDDDARPT